MEEWKIIQDFPAYEASTYGRVRRIGGTILTPLLKQDKYYYVNLYNNRICKTQSIHRIIALVFLPNPYNKPTVDHIDKCKTNNNISNLRWATHAEQMQNYEWSNNTSGYNNIRKTNAGWQVRINRNNKIIIDKVFTSLEEALMERDRIKQTAAKMTGM